MVDVTTSPTGTSITYPPYAGYGGYGNGNNNGNNATLQAENFLAHLVTNNDRHSGEHHILNRLSQIQADIPTMEGAVQSAISASQNAQQNQASTYALGNANAQAQYALSGQNQVAQTQLQLATQFGNIVNDIANAREAINLQTRNVNDAVNAGTLFNAQQFGQASTQAAVNTGLLNAAIIADGDRTRTLISQQYVETLNRQLATANNEIIELRGDRNGLSRHHETEIRVNQNVNQQQQQQQMQNTFGAILGRLEGLTQVAHATNQNIIAGNQGAVQTGAQNSTPTNIGRV